MSIAELVWNRYRREALESAIIVAMVVLVHAVWSCTDFDAAARGFAQTTNPVDLSDSVFDRRLLRLEKMFATNDLDSTLSDTATGWTRLSAGNGIWIAGSRGEWKPVMERLGTLEVRSRQVVLDSVSLEWRSESMPLELVVRARRQP